MLLAALTLLSSAQACTAEVLQAAIDDAFSSFLVRSQDDLRAARQRIEQTVACLEEPIDPPLVRHLHLAVALDEFARYPRDDDAVYESLKGVDPQDLDSIVSAEHLLAQMMTLTQQQTSAPPIAVVLPEGCCLLLDGEEATARPIDRAALVQLTDETGTVLLSGWLAPEQPVPVEHCPPIATVAAPSEPGPTGRGLRMAGGAGLAVSSGLLTAALIAQHRYTALDEQPLDGRTIETLQAEADGLRQTGNTLASAAVATSTLSTAALGVGLILRW